MDEDWDSENFEAKVILPKVPVISNKWEGEDEDDDVKESWEDEEEEKKDVEKVEPKSKPKPKKALADKIAEKERQQLEELERKQKEREKEMTPEEKLAEKLRRQKLQEESDLQLAKETFGITDNNKSIDSMNPVTKDEFVELADTISKKVQSFSKNSEYPSFIEDLVRSICVTLNSNDLKKLKTTVDNLLLEKQKVEKGEKSKKSKGKGKAKLKIEGDNSHLNEYSAYQDYDYDDFM